MSNYILPRLAPERKSETPPFPVTDLHCPRPECRSGCYFSSAGQRVWCPVCGWSYSLSAEQAAELADAVGGITDLPIAQYLQILASDDTATSTQVEEQRWIAEEGQA
jgi:hypothetical protein